MDQKIKQIAEQYAAAHSEEQKELLRTLGKIPAPTLLLYGLMLTYMSPATAPQVN